VTRLVGLTASRSPTVFNACATAASLPLVVSTTSASPFGLDKHPRGAFTDDPAKLALPQWYAENGPVRHHQVLRDEANKYLHDHNILPGHAGQGRRQELPQRCAEPECVPPQADSRDQILNSAVLNYPLTQYMFCAPDEGAAA